LQRTYPSQTRVSVATLVSNRCTAGAAGHTGPLCPHEYSAMRAPTYPRVPHAAPLSAG
jgi:hypothetical protein